MIQICTPDSSPEELAEFQNQLKRLSSFLNTSQEASALLAKAQKGEISEAAFMEALVMLASQEGVDL